jgi:DNA polymerase III delta prime subunit
MIEKDERFILAESYVEETGISVFLTGKAGTGKTTFLKEIVRQTSKRFAVVAPTGVAAINAGGVTIHSFFQLPLCPFLPDVKELVTEYQMPERMRSLRKDRVKILRTLDLLVIDEISMVRADILDAVDDSLRRYRRSDKPFGGVQLLMIGDIQQLPPVVKDAEKPFMEQVYPSPFFFNSKALRRLPYVTIELEKVHRQSDKEFLDILNEVRSGRPGDEALKKLNTRLDPDFTPPDNERWIRLTTHNAQADSVNNAKMEALKGKACVFKAAIDGIFPENAYPAETDLRLKEGAQVMFIRNDTSGQARYYNGKIATVEKVKPQLVVRDEGGDSIVVTPEKWENIRYGLNDESGEIEGIVEGTFEQMPLRPAWAVTIHKSQGLTFDNVIIDAGSAFSFGQVYVALSRCRTLEGIVLTTPITRRCTFTSEEVTYFENSQESAEGVKAKLPAMSNEHYISTLCEAFDLQMLRYFYNRVNRVYQVNLSNTHSASAEKFNLVGKGYNGDLLGGEGEPFTGIRALSDTARTFQSQIRRITASAGLTPPEALPLLKERVAKACEYFRRELGALASFAAPLTLIEIGNKEVNKAFRQAAEDFLAELKFRLTLYKSVMDNGFDVKSYHKLRTDKELAENRSLKALAKSLGEQ